MSVRNGLRLFASYYRKSARFAVFIIFLASFAIPAVLASPPGSLGLSPNVNVNAVTPFGCGNTAFPPMPRSRFYVAAGRGASLRLRAQCTFECTLPSLWSWEIGGPKVMTIAPGAAFVLVGGRGIEPLTTCV